MGKERKKKKGIKRKPNLKPKGGRAAPLPTGCRCGGRTGCSPAGLSPRGISEPAGAAPGSARHRQPRPGGRRQLGEGPSVLGAFFRSLQNPAQVCPRGKLPRAMRLQQRDPHPGARRRSRGAGAAAPRAVQSRAAASPYLAFRPSSFFFQFSDRCLESAGSPPPRGRREPPPPACAGSGALPGRWVRGAWRRGCPRCALLKTGSSFRAEPSFFFFFLPSLLPPFPSSLPPSLSLSPFFPSPSLSHSPAFKDGTASHCVFMYIIRQLVPSTSFASLQYLYKHITLSVACTFCYGCCHSLRDLTFIF